MAKNNHIRQGDAAFWKKNLGSNKAASENPFAHSGGGGYDGGMEARVAVLEQIAKDTKDVLGKIDRRMERVEDNQRADFRLLFGAIITVAIGLAGLMARGFHWL